jgi:hypothetical protein
MSDTPEIWRPIEGYEGLYEVSNLGRVRRLEAKVWSRNRWGRCRITRKAGVLKPLRLGNTKYLGVQLCKEGKISARTIHSMVCIAFHGPRPVRHHAAHLDGNCKHNAADNLAWVTPRENQFHRIAHGTANRGSRAHQSILSPDDVREIRRRRANGETGIALGKEYGVHLSTIYKAANGRNWPELV